MADLKNQYEGADSTAILKNLKSYTSNLQFNPYLCRPFIPPVAGGVVTSCLVGEFESMTASPGLYFKK
ncbi:MAG: hypothetical protein SFU87_18510 [Chitinophagaceae bacterium]|nr:hypothetical protein [Chitinophagaceae bacterium]